MLGDLPVFSILKARMDYQQTRQKVLAENIANADTPGYRARDLRRFQPPQANDLLTTASVRPAVTQPGHMAGLLSSGVFDAPGTTKGTAYETTPSGTAVSLEDEMMKLSANQADYQAAATLYSKSLAFLRIAIGRSA
jgi:flagellar basal-body rod protein FlgB